MSHRPDLVVIRAQLKHLWRRLPQLDDGAVTQSRRALERALEQLDHHQEQKP